MKTDFRFSATIAKGMDERVPADPESADLIENFTRDSRTNAWDNRIGYEKYLLNQSAFDPWTSLSRIDSLFIWNRHNGAQEILLHESGGTLYFLKPFQAQLAILESGRDIPTITEACTQYVPMGRWIIILNGYNRPIKWSAWPLDITAGAFPGAAGKLVYDVGWEGAPAAPDPYSGYEDPGKTGQDIRTQPGRICSIPALAMNTTGGLGDWTTDNTFLGTSEADELPAYFYKVTFVNNTGSESPISGSSVMTFWVNGASKSTYALIVDLPKGPIGTVARRIYRTKNQGDAEKSVFTPNVSSGDGVFRYVGQIDNNIEEVFVDTVSDSELGGLAPNEIDSIPMPAPKARFGAVFKGSLFLDGGAGEDSRIYWSYPGTPDTFNQTSFMDLSGRPGGAITGLYSYYDMLLVFREGCIDVVQGDYTSGFRVTTLRQGITCKSPNTIATIPDVGVIFLAEDGIYILRGSMVGGAQVEVKRISDVIRGTIDRVNKDALARATGAYSQKWKEYHVYFPADGEDIPTLGIVFHVEDLVFSVRSADFPVGCLDVNLNGDLIFGHNKGTGGSLAEHGLFVISKARQNGYSSHAGEVIKAAPVTSVWRSPFHNFGRPEQKKFVKYVYLYVVTTGSNKIAIEYMKDYELTGNNSAALQMQMPDRALQQVWDTVVIDQGTWERPRVTEIRYPIADGACSHFQFQVRTSNDFLLVGYSIDYQANQTKMIRGRK